MLPKKGLSGMTMPGLNSDVIVLLSSFTIFWGTEGSQFAGMKPLQPL
jgi:hypothetical protein